MARTDAELDREFRDKHRSEQWAPVTAEPTLSREQRRADLRQRLLEKTGSEALADLSISHLTREADARMQLESQLREELARVDASISAFAQESSTILAPLEARLAAAQHEVTAAASALELARSARDSMFTRGLGARRIEILGKLRGVDVLQGRIIPWRESQGTATTASTDGL